MAMLRRGDGTPVPLYEEDREWQRFAAKVEFGDCWVWTGCTDDHGYGSFGLDRRGGPSRTCRPHQYTWQRLVGPVPDGLELDHVCRNTACCNPDHLEPVTHEENMRRSPHQRQAGGYSPVGDWQLAKTRCPRNHPYDEENTGRRATTGHRYCRACARERMRARRLESQGGRMNTQHTLLSEAAEVSP